jgi:hypothetical protein
MTQHTDQLIETLLDVAQGHGGQFLNVVGDPRSSGEFWAGTRFKPVGTLFEAVVRCLLAGGYERIVAFTGHRDKELPDWRIGPNFHLHDEAMIWLIRGEKTEHRQPAARAANRLPWEENGEALRHFTAASRERLVWRSSNRPYWERLEAYSGQLEAELRRAASGKRVALIVDYSFLIPTAQESVALRETALDARRRNSIRSGVYRDVQNTSLDLILVSEDTASLELAREQQDGEPPNICKVISGYMAEHEWERYRPTLEGNIPHLRVGATGTRTVYAARATSPLPSRLISWNGGRRSLYELLRSAELNRKPPAPAPPKDSRQIALEFWADLDLKPLRRALDEEIIGQTEAKEDVFGIFRDYQEKCAKLLALNRQARKTYEDTAFCLPVVGLFGAAGMGKTTFCDLIIKNLFNDESFGRRIDLAGKSLKVATIGVEPPMVGSDDQSDLISFSRHTNGLGIVCFDEFTRIQLNQQSSLADTLGPLLQILQERRFEASNPKFRPPERFYYFANTLFVFSGNVSGPGEPTPDGFHSIASLGPAFATRVTKPIYFKLLSESDYRLATSASLVGAARRWARDFLPDAYSEGQWEVDDRLLEAVEGRFRRATGLSGEPPSIRRLKAVVDELRFEMAFNAVQRNGNARLTLGTEILPQGW